MKELIRKNYKLYIFFLIPSIFIFLTVFIKNNGVFLFSGDTYEQTLKFYMGGWEKIHSGNLGFWDWSLGFGGNIFSYVLYFISSPVFWFTTLFEKTFLPYALLIANILQFWIGCIFMHMWLSKINTSSLAPIIGSFMFVFSGWSLGYMRYEWTLLAIVFYPLILYFTEIYLEKNKFILLCISIGLLGISNFLLLYQFIPFLYLYTFFRYLIIHKSNLKLVVVFKELLKFLCLTLLGIGISAVILLPTAYIIFSMPRFSGNSTSNIYSITRLPALFKIFSSLFTPVFERQNVNFFINSNLHQFIGWGGGGSLYSLIITPVLLPLIILSKDKFKRNLYLTLLIIMIIFTISPLFSYLFNRSIDVRWIYMIVFTNILICTEVVDQIELKTIENKYLKYSYVLLIILFIIIFSFSFFHQYNDLKSLISLFKSTLVLLIFAFIYIILFKYNLNKALIILLSLEAIYCGYTLFKFNTPVDYKIMNDENLNNEAIDWLNSHDDTFYRVLYDLKKVTQEDSLFDVTTSNEPLAQGFKGVSFYSSLYNTNQSDFLNRFLTSVNMPQLVGRENIYNLLSTKYFYTSKLSQPIPYGFELIESNSNFTIYENKNFVNLGYVCENTINTESIINLTFLEQDRIMQKYCITESSKNTIYSLEDNIKLLNTFNDSDIRIYEFDDPVSNVRLYIENFGIPTYNVDLYYDNQLISSTNFWQFNYGAVVVDKNQLIDKIIISGKDEYGYGTMVNLYIENLDGTYEKNFTELTKLQFYDVNTHQDQLNAKIDISNDSLVYTSIPYDKGWRVYVDDLEIPFEKVNLGFIGFNLTTGTHEITIKFTPPLFNFGILISLVSLVILWIISYINYKKRKS